MTYTVIENGTLIDGTGKEPLKNAQVVIKNNRIQSVNQMDKVSDLEQEDVTFIDAKGGYILPGMIDTHVHLTFEFLGLEERVDTPLSLRFYRSEERRVGKECELWLGGCS